MLLYLHVYLFMHLYFFRTTLAKDWKQLTETKGALERPNTQTSRKHIHVLLAKQRMWSCTPPKILVLYS